MPTPPRPTPLPPSFAPRLVRALYGDRATEPRPLASGAWSQAYALMLNGAEVVLRVGAHGEDFAKDEVVARLAGPGLPVPPVLARGEAEGWAYAVSGRVRGSALDDLSGEAVARTLPSLLRALDAAARVDLAGTSGYGIWTSDGLAPHASWPEALLAIGDETPRVPGWRTALVDIGFGLGPVEAGLSALGALTPYLPDERRLIHGDLLSRNVLVGEGAITGVLDWGNALYGDPLYDAAWLLHWWTWYPGWRPGDLHGALLTHWRATGATPVHLRERLHAYLLHIALDALAYCAYRRRWDEVRAHLGTVLALAAGECGEGVLIPPGA
ncbi:aminoglycoside phosphotransferase family protein [Streptomyces albidoflavus]|uniref:phosphotransferase family protein n=1 Tax=Streptomyces albidoflavus TaxID=1886 RepID=UPI0033C9F0CB